LCRLEGWSTFASVKPLIDKSMKPVFKVLLMAFAYLVAFVLGSLTGLIHPMCYAYVGALLPLLFAFIYLYTSTFIRSFGVATALNGVLLFLLLIAGEADWALVIGFIILTALAEIIRGRQGYDTLKGIRLSFLPFAYSFFAYTAHWWTDTQGSLAAAVEEMPAGYDQLMIPVIENIPVLIIVLIITLPVAMLAIRLAERSMKKQLESFK
jgi:hypothetical protein